MKLEFDIGDDEDEQLVVKGKWKKGLDKRLNDYRVLDMENRYKRYFESSNPLEDKIKRLIPKIVTAAQKVYDQWDETDEDTYGGGGICHLIADGVCNVLDDIKGASCSSVSSSHEVHVFAVIGQVHSDDDKECYVVDIPYSYYEHGGGYSWTKIPDVRFRSSMVHIMRVSYDDYFNEDGELYDM